MDAYPAGKTFTTLETQMSTGGEVWVMVLPQVHGKQLLLSEVFVAGQAGEGLLSRVRAHVRGQASLLRESRDIADTGCKSSLEPSVIFMRSPSRVLWPSSEPAFAAR